MRVVRTLLGIAAITLALPLLIAGTAMLLAGHHRSADGWFVARLDRVDTPGYAVVVPDVDALLQRDATLARRADTRLRISARTGSGPAFVGLAPRAALERYLSGVPYATLSGVRPALGPLPVTVSQVGGTARPDSQPAAQPFWVAASVRGTVDWSPGAIRGQQLALVVMRPDGTASLDTSIDAALRPAWLGAVTWGAMTAGVAGFVAGLVLLLWPARGREVVYVVEPGQVEQVATRLGLRSPRLALTPPAQRGPRTLPDPARACPPGLPSPVGTAFPPGLPSSIGTGPAAGQVPISGVPAPAELVAVAQPPPGWMLATAEIVDVSSVVSPTRGSIRPDFVWPPVPPVDSPGRA